MNQISLSTKVELYYQLEQLSKEKGLTMLTRFDIRKTLHNFKTDAVIYDESRDALIKELKGEFIKTESGKIELKFKSIEDKNKYLKEINEIGEIKKDAEFLFSIESLENLNPNTENDYSLIIDGLNGFLE